MRVGEAGFQAAVLDLARLGRWLVHHTPDSRRSTGKGFPDLVLVHALRGVLFRELKTSTGRMTPEQMGWQSALTAAGADYAVWTPADMEEIKNTLIPPTEGGSR